MLARNAGTSSRFDTVPWHDSRTADVTGTLYTAGSPPKTRRIAVSTGVVSQNVKEIPR